MTTRSERPATVPRPRQAAGGLVRTDTGWTATKLAVDPPAAAAVAHQGERAGVVSRLLANSIDLVAVLLALLAGYFAVSASLFLWNSRSFTFPSPGREPALLAGLVLLFGYLAFSWATVGRTYGDHVMGLRVVGRNGSRMPWYVAVFRAAFCVVFPIGFFWCAISPRQASVQDIAARTSVRYAW